MPRSKPNHHELPRLYLKGFCESGISKLWVFRRLQTFSPGFKKGKNNPFLDGLAKIGVRKDQYAIRVPGQSPDFSYEVKLQREEHKADIQINKIRNREAINRADKEIIARYIGMMKKRLTRQDLVAEPILGAQITNFSWDNFQRNLAYAGNFKAALQVPKVKKFFSSGQGKTKVLRENMIKPFNQVHAALMEMIWSFQITPTGEYFVTSDNPIVFDETLGLKRSPLIFPIGQHVALLAQWAQSKDLSFTDISKEETRKINSIIIAAATKEVYSPKPDKWIYEIMGPATIP